MKLKVVTEGVKYEIVEDEEDEGSRPTLGIRCKACDKVSWNLNDVRHKFCANCGQFHETQVFHRRRSKTRAWEE